MGKKDTENEKFFSRENFMAVAAEKLMRAKLN